MHDAVLLSLNPEWFDPIMKGKKKFEVRKKAPLLSKPFKVYLYCTKGGKEKWLAGVEGKREAYKMNGTVCGEFTCDGVREETAPFPERHTGLTQEELKAYAGKQKMLYYMIIKDPKMYDQPVPLERFGTHYPPQSWQYVEEMKE